MKKEEESLEERLKADEKDAEIERLHANLSEAEKKLKDYSKKDKHYETLENELKKAKKKLAKYEKAKKEYKPKPKPKKEGKKQRQQKKAPYTKKVTEDQVKEPAGVSLENVLVGLATGVAAYFGTDYLTGSHATESYNIAGCITLALNGTAMGICGGILGTSIARIKYKSSLVWKKINKIFKVGMAAGAVTGGVVTSIASSLGYVPLTPQDKSGAIAMFGGLLAAIPVGYLIGYATKAKKQDKSK